MYFEVGPAPQKIGTFFEKYFFFLFYYFERTHLILKKNAGNNNTLDLKVSFIQELDELRTTEASF